MNDNDYIHEWISRYNEGDLKGAELEEFLRILKSDPEVRSETETDRELSEFLQDRDLLEFREILDQVRNKKRRGFGLNCLLLAAVLVTLVAISGFWIYEHPGRIGYPAYTGSTGKTSTKDPVPGTNLWKQFFRQTPGYPSFQQQEGAKRQDELAANFRPLSYMEGVIGIVTRDGQFRLLAPENVVIQAPGDSLVFRWTMTLGNKLSFEVINNLGQPVLKREEVEGFSLTLSTQSLKEGLYYWKFLCRDNLVSAGKIMINR